MLSAFIKKNKLPEEFKHLVKEHYLPLDGEW
jgi:hypothetical protein